MSVILTVRVLCELPEGCDREFEAEGWPDDVRAQAKKSGWGVKPDRCPAHPAGQLADAGPTLFDDHPEVVAAMLTTKTTRAAGHPAALTGTEAARLNAGRGAGDPVVCAGLIPPAPADTPDGAETLLQRFVLDAGSPLVWVYERYQIGPGYLGESIMDPQGAYRYALARRWAAGRWACWVMLNPSTADAGTDDATIRKVVAYSRRWNFGGALVLNLFAVRATDPKIMRRFADPVGPDNDEIMRGLLTGPRVTRPGGGIGRVVLGWGVHGAHLGRGDQVARLVHEVYGVPLALAVTGGGHPGHPLYLAGDLVPFEYAGKTL